MSFEKFSSSVCNVEINTQICSFRMIRSMIGQAQATFKNTRVDRHYHHQSHFMDQNKVSQKSLFLFQKLCNNILMYRYSAMITLFCWQVFGKLLWLWQDEHKNSTLFYQRYVHIIGNYKVILLFLWKRKVLGWSKLDETEITSLYTLWKRKMTICMVIGLVKHLIYVFISSLQIPLTITFTAFYGWR